MNEQQTASKNYFQELFASYERGLNGARKLPIHQLRRSALAEMTDKPFPTRRNEDWKYTSVNKIISTEYQEGTLQNISDEEFAGLNLLETEGEIIRMVFVNGVLDESRSFSGDLPGGLRLQSIQDTYNSESVRERIEHFLPTEAEDHGGSAFISMNRAFNRSGILIETERNTQIDVPVHLIYISTAADAPTLANPQTLLNVAGGSNLTIIEEYRALDGAEIYFNNAVTRGRVGQNAHLHHYRIQREGAAAYHINHTKVWQAADSTYAHYNADLGGSIVRNTLEAIHEGKNITTNMYGAFLGSDRQHVDTQSFIDHAEAHCQSNELYKGILQDRARGVFNGKIIVRQDAQKINAFQQNSTLLLSDTAQMDAKPQLEIYADDVRCSHGATIGQLDEKSVFYLRSRGLSDAQARGLLQYAFVKEVMDGFHHDAVREYATDALRFGMRVSGAISYI